MENQVQLPTKNEKGIGALERANALVIVTPADYAAADNLCVGLKGLEKEVDAAWDSHISAAFAAHRALVAKKKVYAEPIEAARRIIKAKMNTWQEAEEEKRRAEERRLQEEANKRAEEEALAAAEEAQKAGQHEVAEAIISAPVEAPVVVLPPSAPKAQTTMQTRWDFRVVNPALVPNEYKMLDTVKIGQVVRATKGSLKIPGIEVFSKRV